MSSQNTARAAPARPGNGSQRDDQLRQATKEINARETIQVALDRYQDREVVDLRTWLTTEDGSLRPTRTGITLAIRHLPQLAEALAAALTVARERGLLTDHDGGAF
jgi:hypothetical protein